MFNKISLKSIVEKKTYIKTLSKRLNSIGQK